MDLFAQGRLLRPCGVAPVVLSVLEVDMVSLLLDCVGVDDVAWSEAFRWLLSPVEALLTPPSRCFARLDLYQLFNFSEIEGVAQSGVFCLPAPPDTLPAPL